MSDDGADMAAVRRRSALRRRAGGREKGCVTSMGATSDAGPLRSSEFRTIWLATILSVVGDQLARVALATLVYDRTNSAFWAATTWALTFLPAVAGGIWLGQLADRYPRREVMVATDLLRAAAFAAMAWRGLPLWATCALLTVAVAISPLFTAARGALLPEVLPDRLYDRGVATLQITGQVGQLAGFAVAGAVVAALAAPLALLLDAGTFVGSAVLLVVGLRRRPASRTSGGGGAPSGFRGLRAVVRDPARRPLVLLAWLVGCFAIPEGLAVPYVGELGGDAVAVGVLLASLPAGSIAGAWLLTRVVPEPLRPRLVGPLAVAAGLPLLVTAWVPGLAVVCALWFLTGACTMAYLLQTQVGFVRATPADARGQGLGAVSAGMITSQGLAVVAAGALAEQVGAAATIAAGGAGGALLAVVIASGLHLRRRRTGPDVGAAPGPGATSIEGGS